MAKRSKRKPGKAGGSRKSVGNQTTGGAPPPPSKPEGWRNHAWSWHYFREGSSLCGKFGVQILGGGPIRKPWPTELTKAERKQRVCEACDAGVTALRAEGSEASSGAPAASTAASSVREDLSLGLTPKQALFVREYLVDQNGTRAAIAAGYAKGSAHVTASKLLRQANVQAALAIALAPKIEKVELTVERVLEELMAIGFSNLAEVIDEDERLLPIHKWPLRMQRAIGSIEIAREKITQRDESADSELSVIVQDQIIKIKPWEKTRALEMLARNLKMLTDKLEVEGKLDVTAIQQKHRESLKGLNQQEIEELDRSAADFIAIFEAKRKARALAAAGEGPANP